MTVMPQFQTPALVLDLPKFDRNVARLNARTAALGVPLRPHMKTVKSVDLWRRMVAGPEAPITVSTLKEAEVFAEAGATDILYAVGITPEKAYRVAALRARGVDLKVVVDSVEAAEGLDDGLTATGRIPALIEIDTDGRRAGVAPDDTERLLAIARALAECAELRGVMTHAGASYAARGGEAMAAMAEQERSGAVEAAETLRKAGFPCPVVSVGSTPTAHFARDLTGVTEVRAGVYMFMDLVMAGLGVCMLDDIAISVVSEVIGRRDDKGWLLLDAGWMALSRDRGTGAHKLDQGYGLVCDYAGRVYPDLIVQDVNQEHGIAAIRAGSNAELPRLNVGASVRILPIHACATAAQFDNYEVLGAGMAPDPLWPRFRGW
jgi:D-serine deaminase-like pyridoxal phosphate-dependent protein